TVMFEGVPSWPDWGRFWLVVERHKVNIFYTAPTAIRVLEMAPLSFVEKSDLTSLKTLGTVGEPINEEAWHWYDKNIGKGHCPIVDTWSEREIGGFMISSIASATFKKPAFTSYQQPGVQPAVVIAGGPVVKGTG